MIYVKHVCRCSDRELADFEWFASMGSTTPRVQLERIRFFAFAYEGDELIACRALKLPYYDYKCRIFEAADASKHIPRFRYESGYSFTLERFRGGGLSTLLLRMLLDKAPHPVYATTVMHNTPIIKVMCKVGARPLGTPFASEQNGMIMLWRLKS